MLELKNIVKKYGNNVILDDISLQIKKEKSFPFSGRLEAERRHY